MADTVCGSGVIGARAGGIITYHPMFTREPVFKHISARLGRCGLHRIAVENDGVSCHTVEDIEDYPGYKMHTTCTNSRCGDDIVPNQRCARS